MEPLSNEKIAIQGSHDDASSLKNMHGVNPDCICIQPQGKPPSSSAAVKARISINSCAPFDQLQCSTNYERFTNRVADLPGMFNDCDLGEPDLFPSETFIKNPNPVRLPSYQLYPPHSIRRSRFFCCTDFSESALHDMIKAVIEHIYLTVLNQEINFSTLHFENHQKLHRAIESIQDNLNSAGMLKMFGRVAKTFTDGRAADVLIDHGLNAGRNSYSNASGEFMLTESFVRDVFSLKQSIDTSEYSKLQPVSTYFLHQLEEYSAGQPNCRLSLERVPSDDTTFIVRIDRKNNRPFLPILYCIGIIVGCPFAGFGSSKVWVFKKEVLYLCAKLFGMLDVNIAHLLYELMMDDIQIHSKLYRVYCRPLWKVLMSVERNMKEIECLSHVPRTSVTITEISRFAEIVERHMALTNIEASDKISEYNRIINLYECRHDRNPRLKWIKAVLMYERRQMTENMPQFVPKLKWIHNRRNVKVANSHPLEEE